MAKLEELGGKKQAEEPPICCSISDSHVCARDNNRGYG